MRILLIFAAAWLAAPAIAHAAASPGAAGLGDRLFPKLGNGGYDVQHYDIDLNFAANVPSQAIDGTVTITAKAKQALSRFDLDFAGGKIGAVAVNGARAKFSRSGQELVITPAKPLPDGKAFTVEVSHYTAKPNKPSDSNVLNNAFVFTPDGTATLPEPAGAHVFLPSNDHPRDKATFTFHVNVPAGETAVANGDLTSQTTANGRTVYVYDVKQPMATYLIQLAVGSYKLIDRGAVDGVHVRDVIAPSLEPALADKLPSEAEQLAWMKARFGPYPFGTYGSLVIDARIGASLETQTLSIFDRGVFQNFLGDANDNWATTMVHELSHEWFGDSVSPQEWSDVWLNEGHARLYEWIYASEHPGELRSVTGDPQNVEDLIKSNYEDGDLLRRRHGGESVAKPRSTAFRDLFSAQQYDGGALVLYALRQKVGDATFQRIERQWLTKYAGKSASTADYIALASKVSGKRLGPYLHDWLYGSKTPPMPGHPDWKVKPLKDFERPS